MHHYYQQSSCCGKSSSPSDPPQHTQAQLAKLQLQLMCKQQGQCHVPARAATAALHNPQSTTRALGMAERPVLLPQEVEVRQAVQGEQQGPNNMLPQIASPGDLLLDNVDASDALSVLVQQPAYQVLQRNGKASRSTC
jgi:hypothetical protein